MLIHSTAGLTVMEALVCGCSVISYGWGRGHIRANNAAFALHGMAQVARDRRELAAALAAALAAPAGRDRLVRHRSRPRRRSCSSASALRPA